MTLPARPPRDQRLDIVRGWMQLTIFASHVAGSFIGGWLIFGSWGLSDSSEQFVFLSGFTLGSVFARKALRDGWRAGTLDILWRTRRLYLFQLTCVVLFALLVAVTSATFLPGESQLLGWDFLFAHPAQAVPDLLVMLYQPEWMGILPVFVWCMLLLPGFAALEARFGDRALLAPLACYVCVRLFGLAAPSLEPGGGIAFNPFAWQMLFLTGAWLGRRTLLYGRALPFNDWWSGWVTATAVLMVLIGLALRLGWYGFAPWPPLAPEIAWVIGKEDLALPRLLHAMALAWLVAAFVPREAAWMYRPIARWIALIGRFSLEVFCLGMFLSWAATTALRLTPSVTHPLLDPLLIGLGGILLARFAQFLDRRRTAARVAVA